MKKHIIRGWHIFFFVTLFFLGTSIKLLSLVSVVPDYVQVCSISSFFYLVAHIMLSLPTSAIAMFLIRYGSSETLGIMFIRRNPFTDLFQKQSKLLLRCASLSIIVTIISFFWGFFQIISVFLYFILDIIEVLAICYMVKDIKASFHLFTVS